MMATESLPMLPETWTSTMVGGDAGCAFIDYDNDGDPDITMTNGIEMLRPDDYSKLW